MVAEEGEEGKRGKPRGEETSGGEETTDGVAWRRKKPPA